MGHKKSNNSIGDLAAEISIIWRDYITMCLGGLGFGFFASSRAPVTSLEHKQRTRMPRA